MLKMKKAVSVLIAVITALSAFSLFCSADAWVPPDDDYYDVILNLAYDNPYALNVYLSNFAEAGIKTFNAGDVNTAGTGMLKHFELNAKAYGIKISDSAEGRFMTVDSAKFEKYSKSIFNTAVSAASIEGYNNGNIYAAADNANAVINVCAAVYSIDYIGDSDYRVYFYVVRSAGDISSKYKSTAESIENDISANKLEKLSEGFATLTYNGNAKKASDIDPFDFKIKFYTVDGPGYTAPFPNENTPCNPDGTRIRPEPVNEAFDTADDTSAPVTGKPAIDTAEPETEPAISEAETYTAELLAETAKAGSSEKSSAGSNAIILIIVFGVIIVALIALVTVLLILRKKNKDAASNGYYTQNRQ